MVPPAHSLISDSSYPTNIQGSSSQLFSYSTSQLNKIVSDSHAILFSEIDEVDSTKKSVRRRKTLPFSPIFVDTNNGGKYLISPYAVGKITAFCTQMDESKISESRAGEILDLHSSPIVYKVLCYNSIDLFYL